MAETLKPDARGLVAHPVQDQRLEAINERIASLVAEALFTHLLKHGLVPTPTTPKEPRQDETR